MRHVFSDAVTLQVLLEGVDLPAAKSDLVRYAREQERDVAAVRLLERLPERQYASLDEVGEALAPVQPASSRDGRLPRDESGLPPGGDNYLKTNPTPGAVRHDAPPENPPQKALEQQTKTQNEQKQKQKEMLGDEG
jgi:Protein of unknown function (DUF2795)